MSVPDEFMQESNAQKVLAPLFRKVMPMRAGLPRHEWA